MRFRRSKLAIGSPCTTSRTFASLAPRSRSSRPVSSKDRHHRSQPRGRISRKSAIRACGSEHCFVGLGREQPSRQHSEPALDQVAHRVDVRHVRDRPLACACHVIPRSRRQHPEDAPLFRPSLSPLTSDSAPAMRSMSGIREHHQRTSTERKNNTHMPTSVSPRRSTSSISRSTTEGIAPGWISPSGASRWSRNSRSTPNTANAIIVSVGPGPEREKGGVNATGKGKGKTHPPQGRVSRQPAERVARLPSAS